MKYGCDSDGIGGQERNGFGFFLDRIRMELPVFKE